MLKLQCDQPGISLIYSVFHYFALKEKDPTPPQFCLVQAWEGLLVHCWSVQQAGTTRGKAGSQHPLWASCLQVPGSVGSTAGAPEPPRVQQGWVPICLSAQKELELSELHSKEDQDWLIGDSF